MKNGCHVPVILHHIIQDGRRTNQAYGTHYNLPRGNRRYLENPEVPLLKENSLVPRTRYETKRIGERPKNTESLRQEKPPTLKK